MAIQRIFYAAGPGHVIGAHEYWKRGKHAPGEIAITYSGQFQDLCRELGAEAYIVSQHGPAEVLRDGAFILEHRPKPAAGAGALRYNLAEVRYAAGLARTARRWGADVAVISSGTAAYFGLWWFRLAGIPVVVTLHNSLWPSGHPPRGLPKRLIQGLNATFWRWGAAAAVGISPECVRQVGQLTGGRHGGLYVMRPMMEPGRLVPPPPPPHHERPFRIIFIGRAERNKGIFDILEIARRVESRAPGQVRWEVCGDGSDLGELRRRHAEMGLGEVVTLHGWTAPADQPAIYARCHASIVPTRGDFIEGLAKTAVEAVLSGRPVITNPVVPALEVLRPACVEARTDDVESYVEAVLKLQADADHYDALRAACPGLGAQFHDRSLGLGAMLKQAFEHCVGAGRPAQAAGAAAAHRGSE